MCYLAHNEGSMQRLGHATWSPRDVHMPTTLPALLLKPFTHSLVMRQAHLACFCSRQRSRDLKILANKLRHGQQHAKSVVVGRKCYCHCGFTCLQLLLSPPLQLSKAVNGLLNNDVQSSSAQNKRDFGNKHKRCGNGQSNAPPDRILYVHNYSQGKHNGDCKCEVEPVEELPDALPPFFAVVIELICPEGRRAGPDSCRTHCQ
eukprot:TRINITY_DN265_c0_g1_i6.p1 TRINITY_DN265_c0_g1~~TRINITY_DN265_c0_g1_i6.p1  ORF type:complete len:203 (-),score=18.88 TRINITY_DN265_c0_g1_i6:888-1496(-)